MKTFRVKIKGITPLLHHKMTNEQLMGLLGAKSSKKKDKVIKTPREIAEEHAYKSEDGEYVIPSEYVSSAFAIAAGDFKQSNSSRKSYKSIAGGIFRVLQDFPVLEDDKGKPLKKFEVDIKKGTNHLRGAVAICRPRFDSWHARFDIEIDEDLISPETANHIMSDSGRKVGVGSFRVSKGGKYGQFLIEEWSEIVK